MALSDVLAMLQEDAAKSKMRNESMAASITSMTQQMADQQVQQAKQRSGGKPGGGNNAPVVAPGGMNGIHGLIDPIKGAPMNWDSYGPRIHPITGAPGFHTGVDISAGMGTPIRAASSGIIKRAVHGDSIYGNQIVLGMGHQWQTMYGHMSRLNVRAGQRVRRGQIIGYVGSTGLSTGPHLHYELWRHGNPINPHRGYRRRR